MNKFYTRTGDDGTTGILGEGRVKKYDLRMEALGTLDELTASLGMVRSFLPTPEHFEEIISIQKRIYELMAEVAASVENAEKFKKINEMTILDLEKSIDRYSTLVEVPKEFILPGETPASAAADHARTIARRAERRVSELFDRGDLTNAFLMVYLNRLSSFLFILELKLIAEEGAGKARLAKE